MALGRRGNGREPPNIWPGFVDAMTALLLVLFFVISIFMIVQFVLSETISDQDDELVALSEQVAGLADVLGLEQNRSRGLERELGELNSALTEARNEDAARTALIALLTRQRQELQQEIEESAEKITGFEAQIATLITQNRDLGDAVAEAQSAVLAEMDAKAAAELALAAARQEIDAEAEAARLAAARTEALRAMIAELETGQTDRSAQVSAMQEQIASATQALFLAEAAKRAAQSASSERAAEITALTEAKRVLEEELNTEQLARIAVLQQLAEARISVTTALQTAEEKSRLEALLEDQDARIAAAELALAERASALSAAERGQLAEAAAAEALRTRLANADAELTAMTLSLEAERRRAEDTLTQLAALRAARRELEGQDPAEIITSQQAALDEAARLLAAEKGQSAEAQRRIALLNRQTAALRAELNQLQGLLDASAQADSEANIRIENLGSQLNTALARVAVEERARADAESRERDLLAAEAERLKAEANDLRSFRSEFFGRMRAILGGREELQIVGDRFVFSSEVLFEPGSSNLGHEGQKQMSDVASVLRDVAGDIPPEINWILQVEGHTDTTGQVDANWALSQARALSVVRYLIDVEGFSPRRLAANGYGQFQPLRQGNSPEARAANRRIELKLTER
ncbi:MAG: peptidoglycan -binding protein [Rhodobacteraceae bacterium]|nr:peptidoglycan -binding protein [Paracoccaceae bacterium]